MNLIRNEDKDIELSNSSILSSEIFSIDEDAMQMSSDKTSPRQGVVSDLAINRKRQFQLGETEIVAPFLNGDKTFTDYSQLKGNIENYIGMTMVPTGIIGPVKVNGSSANGQFYVPLATTEGALVASYQRGTKACFEAGGVTSICVKEGLQRSPGFKFTNLSDLMMFVEWLLPKVDIFKEITGNTSRYAKLQSMKTNIEGNHLILIFEFQTGDAAGQNMVTICSDQICRYIIQNTPIQPKSWYIDANYSGDKKATTLSFTNVRGKKIISEITLSRQIISSILKTTPEAMAEFWLTSTMGIIQSGAIGAQGHYANGLSALFLATGQDVACVAESATGISRMELSNNGDLYVSVTIPNLVVGTVGGGTALPTQKECLEMIGCFGKDKSTKFAEICGAVLIGGEISLAAAMSANHFTSAHKNLGR